MRANHTALQDHKGRAAYAARPLLVYVALAVVIICMLATVPVARADEPTPADAVSQPDVESTLISLGSDISSAELEDSRAKAMLEIDKVFVNDQELNGTVTGNTAINSNNGANSIAGTAFSGASGFVSTIQNTGNNVLIQSATIVNVAIEN